MVIVRFKKKEDEIKFFLRLRNIENIYDIRIKYAEMVNDLDARKSGKFDSGDLLGDHQEE